MRRYWNGALKKNQHANAPALGEERQLYPAAEKHGREYRCAGNHLHRPERSATGQK